MSTKAAKKVSIVGGGISGLTAAYLLAKQGKNVVVYEKGDNVAASTNIIVNNTHVDIGFLFFNPVCPIFSIYSYFHFFTNIFDKPINEQCLL